ncbi:MAG: glycosyltransferase [Acidobacteriota bacterium]|nr:glycosyltransferase [Acidobacteriota bacterium]
MVNLAPSRAIGRAGVSARPRVHGKFIFVGDEKLYIRGVTYGTFRPQENGEEYPEQKVVDADFARMVASGINTVRVYTVPPTWLLDAASRHGLYVMVGLPWEQHIAFLEDRERMRSIEESVRAQVRRCAGHPSVLCYSIGNEIPATIVRWHGRRRVERFLKRLYKIAKSEDPGGLVTYVNYPSTEYLQLPFVDFLCFNVYLESRERFASYLARLQNMAGDRPLVLAEIGLDSQRNGLEAQAASLEWQIRTAFAGGCAGTFVFAWTDQWYRGGFDIEDWDFGLTTRNRDAKPALLSVEKAYAEVPFPQNLEWPRVSVVVCSYNGARVVRDCLEGLSKLDYPNFEVIVVNDGSKDATESIALEYSERYGFRVISTENRGLSSARNTGLEAATGEIVAYIDDDAYPDPHWLTYLAATFMSTDHAGVGGPNIAPAGDGRIADCVANSPGGPIHVLLSDSEAEHIPGCNMAIRRECLEAIGGFDPQFRVAGDDVDVCWRLQQRGWTLGFNPAAMVWHHRRNSVRAYLRQQKGYGKAEALLERKWPEKYNSIGHLTWNGRVYSGGLTHVIGWRRNLIYQGTWGSALFQSVYQCAPSTFWSLTTMPEWYLITIVLAALSALGILWAPLFFVMPLLVFTVVAPLVQASLSASRASFSSRPEPRFNRWKLWAITTSFHLLQPLARLCGRLYHGLTPWRLRGVRGLSLPWPRTFIIWSERWQSSYGRLQALEALLRTQRAVVLRGGSYDPWDLEVRGGILGGTRVRMSIEEHGGGKQLVRFLLRGRNSVKWNFLVVLLAVISYQAALDRAWVACGVLGVMALLLGLRTLLECAAAMSSTLEALYTIREAEKQRQSSQRVFTPQINVVRSLLHDNGRYGNGHNGNGHGLDNASGFDYIKDSTQSGPPAEELQPESFKARGARV